jgi:5-formyltetrahydrofolate cyclo-ligase
MPDGEKAILRRRLRSARRALGAADRAAAAAAVDTALARMGLPRPRSRIAAYQAMDGEIDPAVVIRRALAIGCEVYYPVITSLRGRRMRFATGGSDPRHAYVDGDIARWLNLVLVPLVAFDDQGNRLGMGAGFYDRHFAFLRHRRAWRRPLLIGLGFELQCVPALPATPHDVPLFGVVTERGVHGRAASRLGRQSPGSAA